MGKLNYVNILDNIVELAGDQLNEWESNFISDIMIKYSDYSYLSDKQKSTILKIQEKYLRS